MRSRAARKVLTAATASLVAIGASAAEDMAEIPAGRFRPFVTDESPDVEVPAFRIDRRAVSRREFASFVEQHPEWSKGRIGALSADSTYLTDLRLEQLPDERYGKSPITYVSWFAARAYCKDRGARLPTTLEWERAAAASATAPDGREDPQFIAELVERFEAPAGGEREQEAMETPNYFGVRGLHGSLWEWVEDFNNQVGSTGKSDAFCGGASLAVRDKLKRDYPAFLRFAFRNSLRGSYALRNLGFRCAR